MLLTGENRIVALRPLAAGVFLGGMAAGFALPSAHAARGAAVGLALWGGLCMATWRLRALFLPLVFLAGLSVAWHTESKLVALERRASFSAQRDPPFWRVTVEGDVRVQQGRRREGRWVSFRSHMGPLPLKVVMPLGETARVPRLGERWRCQGYLPVARNRQKRYACRTLYVREAKMACRLPSGAYGALREKIGACSDFMAHRLSLGLSVCPETAALNRAMLLGRRRDMDAKRRATFVAAGTVHVFAISGLHVMLIARLLTSLVRCTGVSLRYCGLCALFPLAFYVVLIGAPASAVRASLMAGICLVAPALGRRPDSIAAWSVAVFVVYASRPGLFFDAGCALSFTVMLGILVWLKWSGAFARPACLGVWHVRLRTFALYRKSLWLAEGWGVTFAAWVAGAPLVARLFGLFAWSGLIANVLAMRFAALTVAFGFAGLLAGFAGTPAAVAFNLLAALSTRLLTLLSALFAALPGASSAVRPWTLLECAAWYGFFVLALLALEAFWPKRQEGQDEWWLLG